MYIDSRSSSDPLRRRLRRLTRGERIEEALAFVRQFHREHDLPAAQCRLRERSVASALRSAGHYDHTADELAFGARVAWRNHANCIGRLHWKSLEVLDCRALRSPEAIAAQTIEHMRAAQGKGRVRSIISVFAPVVDGTLPAYIENRQIAQYAGYIGHDGRILGDPANVEFTRIVTSLGWTPPAERSAFDLLPLLIRDTGGARRVFDVPQDSIRRIAIRHPAQPGFDRLGLQWYGVPCVSDMIMTIGGIDYPCAPFNGHYMGTEIASRNFVDENRYDRLGDVGAALGLDKTDPLWKDTALVELNRAVLHSFRQARVTIADHHGASEQFIQFAQQEQACGRMASANWAWIVPPQAAAACPTFHLPMTDLYDVPNYYRSRAMDGGALRVSHATEVVTPMRRRWRNAVRRGRNWLSRHA